MTHVRYEQAVYGSFPFWDRGYDVLARSPGCSDAWLADFRRACQHYGEPPRGATGTGALFALRLPSGPWAIVGVCPQGADDRGRPGALAFHGLLLPPREFRKVGFNPFRLEPALCRDWGPETRTLAAGSLAVAPEEVVPADDPKVRWIAGTLAHGRRIALESAEPVGDLARRVWQSLPPGRRRRLSVATLAFGNENRFDLLALPRMAGVALDPSYVTEMPPESSLPVTSPIRFWTPRRLGYAVLAVLLLPLLVLGLVQALPGQDAAPRLPSTIANRETIPRPALEVPPRRIDTSYPSPASYRDLPPLDPSERSRVTNGLRDLAERFGVAGLDRTDDSDPTALMVLVADGLRYQGPWLSAEERARLPRDPDPSRIRALAWDEHLRHFAPDRPLPRDFARGPLRWQLDTLAWSFRLPPDPRRSAAEVPFALADALAVERPVRPSPLAVRYPALESYARFLGRLPRR